MVSTKRDASELIAAALAFDEELERFGRLAEAVRTGPLDSQKNLQRAAKMFDEIGESEKRLGHAAQSLVTALNAARQKQEAHASLIRERADLIEQRSATAADLLQRYGAMGEKASDLNQLALSIAAKCANARPAADSELARALGELRARLDEVAANAQSLTAAARDADFEDIARQADSLRQQITAANDKVAAIEKSLSERRS
jgi:hypothetical protein